jgi:CRISPR-associated protein Csd1
VTWLAKLLQTYENHAGVVGQFERKKNGREYALIPVSHTTQTAHIEVHLSLEGEFLRANVVDKEEASTIIPCTEDSASRTSAPVPYPLFDKLMYVAGDYIRYCDPPKGTPHEDYMKQLRDWCESPEAHPKVQSVFAYLSKGTLMADLIREKVLWVDERGKLIGKWTAAMGEKPELFKVLAGDQESAFVRFAVEVPGEPEARLWRDPSVQQAFIRYYNRKLADEDLCFVTGEYLPYADKHASRIRNSGDKAKLISANDKTGFTYRGCFQNSREAAAVGYEVSQKAHNALKWLIERQGSIPVDGKVFVVWGTDQLDLPDPFGDSFDLYRDDSSAEVGDSTHREFARQIRKALNGYRYEGTYHSRIVIMALDAATPGRLSIVYYRDMERDPFLNRLQDWHETCCWLHRYRKDENNRLTSFMGAPATRDIAYAAYGSRADSKIVKGLLERMLPCIVDGRPIPRDIVRSVVNRASNPSGMEKWEWEKTLSIACALVNKMHQKEGFKVALDERNDDRNYLFGRLLAIADVLERVALGKEEKRATNAIRYMNAFARYPARTWGIIQSNLQPYQARLGAKANKYNRLIDEVGAMLKPEEFTNEPLNEVYLLGFYSQRHDLYAKNGKNAESANDHNENEPNDGEDM